MAHSRAKPFTGSPGEPMTQRKRKPREIPFPLSLLMLPLLFLASAISIPVGIVAQAFVDRRETKFAKRMSAVGRSIEWQAFEHELSVARQGTAIVEWFSLKGPVRIWWTPEELGASDGSHGDELPPCMRAPTCSYCAQMRHRYTDPAKGTARLVRYASRKEHESRGRIERIRGARHISIRGSSSNV